jgi:hypothetical protein
MNVKVIGDQNDLIGIRIGFIDQVLKLVGEIDGSALHSRLNMSSAHKRLD